jgi:hypothetical protein
MPSSASRFLLAPLLLAAALAGCVPPPEVNLSPEAAVRACEAPTAIALRARDSSFQSVVLEPAATSRVERRATSVGSQPLSMVIAGRGTARAGTGIADLRYLCLIGTNGQALFVDVETLNTGEVLSECMPPGRAGVPDRACLADRLAKAERGLAEAEARAITRARGARPGTPRLEIEEPVATSIGAWRVYRDAECARRQESDPNVSLELFEACRVELTRQRVRELGG